MMWMTPPVKLRFCTHTQQVSKLQKTKPKASVMVTYSLSHIRLHLQRAVKADSVPHRHRPNDLPARDVRVRLVHKQRGDESRSLSHVTSIVRAVQNMVRKEGSDHARIRGDHGGNLSVVEELLEGIVGGCENGDVGEAGEGLDEVGLGFKEA